jgi:predicted nucleotidyltransferase component of viral defense system
MVRNSRAVYVLHFYYRSLLTAEEIPVKIEVNFLEDLIYPSVESRINMIVENSVFLKSIGYDLKHISLKAYSLKEIILEKYRAILTRESFKERDLLDLYLISKQDINVLRVQNTMVQRKIESGVLIAPRLLKNLGKNCALLQTQGYLESEDDVSRLTLATIDARQYQQFKNLLFRKLKKICATW